MRTDSSADSGSSKVLTAALGLAILTFAAYLPALSAGFIWDDDQHLTENPVLSNPGGLREIWTTPKGFYYPLVLTSFWAMRQIWGLEPFLYHLVNLLLHTVNALLLWGLLARLSLRGAWFAAALFALHPVHVESVAWVTELKNIQSGFFYLLCLHALLWVRPPTLEAPKQHSFPLGYGACLALFALAVLSKPSTVMLPVVLLGYLVWRRRSLAGRDLVFSLPFFLISAGASAWTVWEQKYHSMAQGEAWSVPMAERLLNAPHIAGFYILKLIWPQPLVFIYPKWEVDVHQAVSYLPAIALAAGIAVLFLRRKSWGEAPLLAMAYFLVTLFPVLGFFNVYFMTYSWVADHFQYLASFGPLALAGSLAARFTTFSQARGGALVPRVVGSLILLTLSFCTWHQSLAYHDEGTLWRDAISKNPGAAMAYNNLGTFLSEAGRLQEAVPQFEHALALNPEDAEYHYNLALALGRGGKVERSSEHFQKAIELRPQEPRAYTSYASLLSAVGRNEEAASLYEKALEVAPSASDALTTRLLLAGLLMRTGDTGRALYHYKEAVRSSPESFDARAGLGVLLEGMGRIEDARREYEAALGIHPDDRISGRLKRLREGTRSTDSVQPSAP